MTIASPEVLKALDPDNGGTIDLSEAQAGATKVFGELDPDKDGTKQPPQQVWAQPA
jgi:hypothetical protein